MLKSRKQAQRNRLHTQVVPKFTSITADLAVESRHAPGWWVLFRWKMKRTERMVAWQICNAIWCATRCRLKLKFGGGRTSFCHATPASGLRRANAFTFGILSVARTICSLAEEANLVNGANGAIEQKFGKMVTCDWLDCAEGIRVSSYNSQVECERDGNG